MGWTAGRQTRVANPPVSAGIGEGPERMLMSGHPLLHVSGHQPTLTTQCIKLLDAVRT
jgi:hypothetical protein